MRKTRALPLTLLLVLMLILTACTPGVGSPSDSARNAPAETDDLATDGATDDPANEATDAPTSDATDAPAEVPLSPVIHPEQVLSPEDASATLGLPVTVEAGSREVDEENGISTLRYEYALSEMTTVSALVQIEQDGLKPAEKLAEGSTARSAFDFQTELLKNEIAMVENVGDSAFIVNSDQFHMAWRGYYVVVAFTKDEYDPTKSGALNLALGQKILENMKRLLSK